MKKLTIAERRSNQLNTFIAEYIPDRRTAAKIINSYYRYVALYTRVAEVENNENLYNTRYCKALQAKEERRRDLLSGYLKNYGLCIFVPWSLPYIGIKDNKSGAILKNVIEPILY